MLRNPWELQCLADAHVDDLRRSAGHNRVCAATAAEGRSTPGRLRQAVGNGLIAAGERMAGRRAAHTPAFVSRVRVP